MESVSFGVVGGPGSTFGWSGSGLNGSAGLVGSLLLRTSRLSCIYSVRLSLWHLVLLGSGRSSHARPYRGSPLWEEMLMGPFRGPYRGSPLRDPCWWAVTTEVAAHWEEVLMGPFRGGTHRKYR